MPCRRTHRLERRRHLLVWVVGPRPLVGDGLVAKAHVLVDQHHAQVTAVDRPLRRLNFRHRIPPSARSYECNVPDRGPAPVTARRRGDMLSRWHGTGDLAPMMGATPGSPGASGR